MKASNRRAFLKHGTAAGLSLAALGLSPRRIFGQESPGFHRLVYRELGSTGFKTTEMGFGCMNMRDPELVHAAIDLGINYIDTAHSYMNGANEEVVGTVMKTKRNDVFLTTKIQWRNPSQMPEMIETSLKRLQTDHVDLLLLHVVSKGEDALRDDLMKIFEDARKKGQTRFIGVSTHANQAEVLNAAVDSKFWEGVLVGYNYNSPPEVTAAIKRARQAGLATIGMKNLITTERPRQPFPDIREDKSGKYTNQQALLKWVLEDRYLDTTIPGMTSFEQLADDLAVMGMQLTFDDKRTIRRYSEGTRLNYCCGVSGCTGCKDQCPNGVQVNELNRCINYAYGYGDHELARENYDRFPSSNSIDICSDCDECVVKCVNGLNLTENIKKARSLFA